MIDVVSHLRLMLKFESRQHEKTSFFSFSGTFHGRHETKNWWPTVRSGRLLIWWPSVVGEIYIAFHATCTLKLYHTHYIIFFQFLLSVTGLRIDAQQTFNGERIESEIQRNFVDFEGENLIDSSKHEPWVILRGRIYALSSICFLAALEVKS